MYTHPFLYFCIFVFLYFCIVVFLFCLFYILCICELCLSVFLYFYICVSCIFKFVSNKSISVKKKSVEFWGGQCTTERISWKNQLGNIGGMLKIAIPTKNKNRLLENTFLYFCIFVFLYFGFVVFLYFNCFVFLHFIFLYFCHFYILCICVFQYFCICVSCICIFMSNKAISIRKKSV